MQSIVSNQTKVFAISLFVLLALTLSWQPAAAGGSDPTPASNPAPAGKTTCGTVGNATVNLTVRWTNVYSAPSGDAVTDINMPHNTNVTMTGRDVWGCWVRITSTFGSGWLPIDSLRDTGVLGLDVVTGGASAPTSAPAPAPIVDVRVCGEEGNTTTASTTRWTDLFSWASPDTRLANKALAPNTTVTINGRDYWGCWVHVTSGGESAWVPVDALSSRGVMSLPILADNSNG